MFCLVPSKQPNSRYFPLPAAACVPGIPTAVFIVPAFACFPFGDGLFCLERRKKTVNVEDAPHPQPRWITQLFLWNKGMPHRPNFQDSLPQGSKTASTTIYIFVHFLECQSNQIKRNVCFLGKRQKKGGKSHFNLMEADLWVRGIISEKTNPPDMAEQTPPEAAAAAGLASLLREREN